MKMKRLPYILTLTVAVLAFVTCQKRPELKIYNLELTDETVTAADNSAVITANYSYPGEIPEVWTLVSTSSEMIDPVESRAQMDETTITARISNLVGDTRYYYRFKYNNGVGLMETETRDFTTQHTMVYPTLSTASVSSITGNSAVSGGTITDTGGSDIVERGVCWSEEQNPTIADPHTDDGTGGGGFISTLTGLDGYTVYYVRAYAKNSEGYGYGNEQMFVTEKFIPKVATADVTEISMSTAVCGGEVLKDGGSSVTARGVCWSMKENPTTDDSHTSDGTGTGLFTSNLTGLIADTTYYVRAYATNEYGTNYGEQIAFTAGKTPPTVTTDEVTSITVNSAQCGGRVTDEGGTPVTARGVCWSTTEYPTINDNHTTDGVGAGQFTSDLTGLEEDTKYYVRAYATNEMGTSYGTQRLFYTLSNVITVITNNVSSITANSAVCSGAVTSSAGIVIDAKGICWSTQEYPTINDNHSNSGSGTGAFTYDLSGLTASSTYYVRAYAISGSETTYGVQKCFNTCAPQAPTGAIASLFSVSPTKKVFFSRGNLQYQASGYNWRFPLEQYENIGSGNDYISPSYAGYIDLFGWGTSGINHGAVAFQAFSTSTTNSDYQAYGSYDYNLNDVTGYADWGYNSISNGGASANEWRTLTKDEWTYLISRPNSFVKAQVAGVNGVILLPDNWNTQIYNLSGYNEADANFTINVFSSSIWSTVLQANGAVFLPTTGYRNGSSYYNNAFGYYWTATHKGNTQAYCVGFDAFTFECGQQLRYVGCAVRLVHDYGN